MKLFLACLISFCLFFPSVAIADDFRSFGKLLNGLYIGISDSEGITYSEYSKTVTFSYYTRKDPLSSVGETSYAGTTPYCTETGGYRTKNYYWYNLPYLGWLVNFRTPYRADSTNPSAFGLLKYICQKAFE